MASNQGSAVSFQWHPARLLQQGPLAPEESYAVIILNQPLQNLQVIERIWARASYRVAADGGANRLYESRAETGHTFDNLDVVVGDLDSLHDDARAHFAACGGAIVHDPDQYSTDFGKAVHYIWERFPLMHIVAIGGLGGRVDQGVSQLHHLYLFQDGRHQIHVRESRQEEGEEQAGTDPHGDVFAKYVGVLPLQGPSVISTWGLEWDVQDWDTQFGGRLSTSNHVLPETQTVQIDTSRPVIFTIALKGGD